MCLTVEIQGVVPGANGEDASALRWSVLEVQGKGSGGWDECLEGIQKGKENSGARMTLRRSENTHCE